MANMKDKIRTVTSKITIAGIAGVGMLAVLLCSGCSAKQQPQSAEVSEVVPEASEPVSEIEVTETSEEPSEEISEVAPEKVELPELPLLDENGEVYVPGMFSEEEVFAAIKRIEDDDSLIFENANKMYEAIAFMLWINSPYISKDTFMKVKNQYFANYEDYDVYHMINFYDGYYKLNYIRNVEQPINYVPVNYLILDEKQGEAALQIVNCYNNYYNYYYSFINDPSLPKASTRQYKKEFEEGFMEEFREYAHNYALVSKENNIGYNPLIEILATLGGAGCDIDYEDGEYTSRCLGYKKVPYDKLGNYDIEITFGDGQTFLFKMRRSPKHVDDNFAY